MTKLVINADDFGYSKAVNLGIVETHSNGVLSSTTLMANMPGFSNAVKLAKKFPMLGVGVHLSMTCGKPILSGMDTLCRSDGSFQALNYVRENDESIDLDQLYLEWRGQINHILQAGIRPTHLDSHHYTHTIGKNYQVIERLSEQYQLPIRNCFNVVEKLNNKQLTPTDAFWNMFNYFEIKDMSKEYHQIKDKVINIIKRDSEDYRKYKLVEAVCHPGYLDSTIWYGSSFNLARLREVDILCDEDLKWLLLDMGYVICRYDEL